MTTDFIDPLGHVVQHLRGASKSKQATLCGWTVALDSSNNAAVIVLREPLGGVLLEV